MSVAGEFGVLGAGAVKTLESSLVGVPTVKSSSNECLPDDCVLRCSKARRLFLEELADFFGLGKSGVFPWRALKNL